jgi:hypothetical protein
MSIFDKIDELTSYEPITASTKIEVTAKKLTYKARQRLPKEAFALPSKRKYPIADIRHARNALARASAFASPEDKKKVYRAVARRYPSLKKSHSHLMETLHPSEHHVHASLPMKGVGQMNYHLLSPSEYEAKVKAFDSSRPQGFEELANHHWLHVDRHEDESNMFSRSGMHELASSSHQLGGLHMDLAERFDLRLQPNFRATVNRK